MRCRFLGLWLALVASPLAAQPDPPPPDERALPSLSIQAGIETTTHYFFRGFLQEDRRLILQPWVDLDLALYEGEGPVDAFSLQLSNWNSLHWGESGIAGDNSSPSVWYEADLGFGVAASFLEQLSVGAKYWLYTSPNDSFQTAHELVFDFAWDDSAFWEETLGVPGFGGVQPAVTLAIELENQADGGLREGVFLGLGIEPGWTLNEGSSWPVTLSLPIGVGLGLSDYCEKPGGSDLLAFVDVGLAVSVPLACLGTRYGAWELSASVHALWLGESTALSNGGDTFDVIGSLGLSASF